MKKDLTLTRAEIIAIRGLKAQEELIALRAQQELAALREDMAHVRAGIEQRLKLKPSAMQEYSVDLTAGRLMPPTKSRSI